ncbi:MAG: D-tyrosyl-tRNA(Tyr) deacylase [Phycisphaeraceae bacterium]|nr:D-tyrosyl-tRNA(Tyr) deacylase [Phycisphaeraceae bacterium]MCB9846940.1 D-tyrosyl-tRNA(Tyr) deacylase [Phycisphaeraceae bacterium]
MKALLQRVTRASVTVGPDENPAGDGTPYVREIGHGLLALVGVERGDGRAEADWLCDKAAALRIFRDDEGRMNRSVLDVGGDVLVISQFTLAGDARKGTRPSFVGAADPEVAAPLVERFAQRFRERHGLLAPTGVFGAMMRVELVNDGPVTLMLERSPGRPA